jgi:hypothetical protein
MVVITLDHHDFSVLCCDACARMCRWVDGPRSNRCSEFRRMSTSVFWFLVLLALIFIWEQLPDGVRTEIRTCRAAPLISMAFVCFFTFVMGSLLP